MQIVNESLPIFLDSVLGGGAEAVVASTLLIVVFGEIIPQSLGVRYGLAIGAYSSPFVLCMMYLFSPVAWPIAKLLDYILGANEEHVRPSEGAVSARGRCSTLTDLTFPPLDRPTRRPS